MCHVVYAGCASALRVCWMVVVVVEEKSETVSRHSNAARSGHKGASAGGRFIAISIIMISPFAPTASLGGRASNT